ncbi:2-oxoglutarate dehydrogenase, mitochondrial [Cyclospora cayetanensis]|uniref:2-oxoglutarate dehydrogenase, mitochondrial n=1 Tax=Cyclospora cayetanensis TaxID=88456 RepID=A0A6P6RQT0_9EIME|nr:2-oxoglutarate dehydrogenase, mitochondrial [Cyclospora cayetanensis]
MLDEWCVFALEEIILRWRYTAEQPTQHSSSSSPAVATDAGSDGFMSGTAASYAEQMLVAWRKDPSSVHASWAAYFSNLERGLSPGLCFTSPPSFQQQQPQQYVASSSPAAAAAAVGSFQGVSLAPHQLPRGSGAMSAVGISEAFSPASAAATAPASATSAASAATASTTIGVHSVLPIVPGAAGSLPLSSLPHQSVHDTSRLIQMIRGYQMRGHELAKINPLSLPRKPPYCTVRAAQRPLLLSPEQYGFTAADLDRVYDTRVPGMQAIHLVVNNQIGFTTNPIDSGSGKYCTDIAKAVDAPIIHVNADDPEAVTFACELALEFRQKFKHDVFIDIVGYRRFGHNELDMPKFTQPLTYTLIARKKPALELYAEKLIREDVVSTEDVSRLKGDIWDFYTREYENSKHFVPAHQYQYAPQWTHLVTPDHPSPPRVTGVRLSTLRDLGRRIFTIPEGFVAHPTISRIFKQRLAAVEGSEEEPSLDFGAAENLAYASLLSDGFHVRLAGQDAQRGTFSHRHAVLSDQAVEAQHCIFDSLKDLRLPHKIAVCNSLLSEYAVLAASVF